MPAADAILYVVHHAKKGGFVEMGSKMNEVFVWRLRKAQFLMMILKSCLREEKCHDLPWTDRDQDSVLNAILILSSYVP